MVSHVLSRRNQGAYNSTTVISDGFIYIVPQIARHLLNCSGPAISKKAR